MQMSEFETSRHKVFDDIEVPGLSKSTKVACKDLHWENLHRTAVLLAQSDQMPPSPLAWDLASQKYKKNNKTHGFFFVKDKLKQ